MKKAGKVFLGILLVIVIAIAGIAGYWYYSRIFYPERMLKKAEAAYDNADYMEAFELFRKAPYSRSKNRKTNEVYAKELAALRKYLGTMEIGDEVEPFYGGTLLVIDKRAGYLSLMGKNPTYLVEENEWGDQEHYDCFLANLKDMAVSTHGLGMELMSMRDEDAMEYTGMSAADAAQKIYPDECASNPDAEWYYPVMIIDVSLPKDDPYWFTVAYGARFDDSNNKFYYGPLQMQLESKDYLPRVSYSFLEEPHQEKNEQQFIEDYKKQGATEVTVNSMDVETLSDGKTMVEKVNLNVKVASGGEVFVVRVFCWDKDDPQSVLNMTWNCGDQASADLVRNSLQTITKADQPVNEYEGYEYYGNSFHIRGLTGNPIYPTADDYAEAKAQRDSE